MTLTNSERLMLTCLFSIMKGPRLMMDKAGIEEPEGEQDIPSTEQCCHAIEILRCGYEFLYDEPLLKNMGFVKEAMSSEDGQFVMGVFHMFDDFRIYISHLS